jgi:hypothetical protein
MLTALPQNRIFAGLERPVWEGFVPGCTYRWERDAKSGYGTPYVWRGADYGIPYRLGYTDGEGCVVRSELEQAITSAATERADRSLRPQANRSRS